MLLDLILGRMPVQAEQGIGVGIVPEQDLIHHESAGFLGLFCIPGTEGCAQYFRRRRPAGYTDQGVGVRLGWAKGMELSSMTGWVTKTLQGEKKGTDARVARYSGHVSCLLAVSEPPYW